MRRIQIISMNKIFLYLFLFVFCAKPVLAQHNPTKQEKLIATAKIWGFLKYYHPEVAEGKFNWDKELFRILPKVSAAKNKDELSIVFMEWIEGLGEVKPCKNCQNAENVDYFNENFDLKWLGSTQLFNSELSKKLNHIKENRHQGKKYYVSLDKDSNKAIITNEQEYSWSNWTDESLRLLVLFRYWNIVEYFFPYKYQTDTDWDIVLDNMTLKFLDSKSETDFKLALMELVASLDDSHAFIYNKKEDRLLGCYTSPILFDFIENKAVITGFYNDSIAQLNNLEIGDVITKVDGKNIDSLFEEKQKYINGSNLSFKKHNAYYYLLTGSDEPLELEISRSGELKQISTQRYLFEQFKYKMPHKDVYNVMDGNIAYVNVREIKSKSIKEVEGIMNALNTTKAIIFDLRNSSPLKNKYLLRFITSEKRAFYKATYPDLDYPGRFIWDDLEKYGSNKLEYQGKVVLLVDESVQSQGEFATMCLQVGDNVTTVGVQTSGADGNTTRFDLFGGFKTKISGVGIFYPDGTEAQRKGVKIDIEVKRTLKGIIEGKDEILEKAIEYVNKQ